MTSRISLIAKFTGPLKQLKRTIKGFLDSKEGVGYILQTNYTQDNVKITWLCMDGEASSLRDAQHELVVLFMLEWTPTTGPKWNLRARY